MVGGATDVRQARTSSRTPSTRRTTPRWSPPCKAAGLVETLQSAGPFTVFAPMNSAFDKLPAGTVERCSSPRTRLMLAKILTCHVVAGQVDVGRHHEDGHGRWRPFKMKTVGGCTWTAKADGDMISVDRRERLCRQVTSPTSSSRTASSTSSGSRTASGKPGLQASHGSHRGPPALLMSLPPCLASIRRSKPLDRPWVFIPLNLGFIQSSTVPARTVAVDWRALLRLSARRAGASCDRSQTGVRHFLAVAPVFTRLPLSHRAADETAGRSAGVSCSVHIRLQRCPVDRQQASADRLPRNCRVTKASCASPSCRIPAVGGASVERPCVCLAAGFRALACRPASASSWPLPSPSTMPFHMTGSRG